MIFLQEGYSPDATLRKVGVEVVVVLKSGRSVVINCDDIISLKLKEGCDISALSFPSRKLSMNFAYKGCIIEGEDISGCTLEVRSLIDNRRISLGLFSVSKLTVINNGLQARIEAYDIVFKLSRRLTGLSSQRPLTLSTFIDQPSGATSDVDFVVDDNILSVLVQPEMFSDVDSQKKCLLMLAQAANAASIWTTRNNKIRISRVSDTLSTVYEIRREIIISESEISTTEEVKYVEVRAKKLSGEYGGTSGTYSAGALCYSLRNDFVAQGNLASVAYYLKNDLNCRMRIKLKTRCDPSLEIGDMVRYRRRSGEMSDDLYLVGQIIEFDTEGLRSELTLAGR